MTLQDQLKQALAERDAARDNFRAACRIWESAGKKPDDTAQAVREAVTRSSQACEAVPHIEWQIRKETMRAEMALLDRPKETI